MIYLCLQLNTGWPSFIYLFPRKLLVLTICTGVLCSMILGGGWANLTENTARARNWCAAVYQSDSQGPLWFASFLRLSRSTLCGSAFIHSLQK